MFKRILEYAWELGAVSQSILELFIVYEKFIPLPLKYYYWYYFKPTYCN